MFYTLLYIGKGENDMFETGFLAIVLLVAGVIVLFKTVRMVPQGFEWTVERFGKYTHTMSPGPALPDPGRCTASAARST